MVCGAIGDAERRRGGEVDAVGNRRHLVRVEQGQLGERAGRGGTEYPVARPEPSSVTGGHHLAGEFAARCERHRNLDLVFAGDQQHIGEVDGRGVNPHQQLARARRRIRDVVEDQIFWRTIGAADDGAHQPAPNPRKQNRTR